MDSPTAPIEEDLELQRTLDMKRAELEGLAQKPETMSWLGPTAQSEEGTEQLLEELERRVDQEDFINVLTESKRIHAAGQSSATSAPTGGEVLRSEWWEEDSEPVIVPGRHVPEATGEYVMIEHSDAVDAVAAFIAAYIVALPEGQSMDPKQLQQAVKQSLKEIRKGRVKRLWDWGRFLYRAAAMSYGAFAAYTNPWVAEAVFKGVFTCVKFARTFW